MYEKLYTKNCEIFRTLKYYAREITYIYNIMQYNKTYVCYTIIRRYKKGE